MDIYLKVKLLDHGNSTLIFGGNCNTVVHSGYTTLYSYHYTRVPVTLHLCQYLLVSVFSIFFWGDFFFTVAILIGMKWYLIMVLICIFLIISDFGHHYRCLLAICTSSLEKCLVKSFARFSLEVFWILLSCIYKSSLWSGD